MNVNKIISFLDEKKEDEFLMKKLKISNDSLLILKLIIKNNIEQNYNKIILNHLLLNINSNYEETEQFDEDTYEYLKIYKYVKELLDMGWIYFEEHSESLLSSLQLNILVNEEIFNLIELKEFKKNIIFDKNKENYKNYNEYIEDYFKFVNLLDKKSNFINENLNEKSPLFINLNKDINKFEKIINNRISNTEDSVNLKLEKFVSSNKISYEKKILILILLKGELDKENNNSLLNEKSVALSILKSHFDISKEVEQDVFNLIDNNESFYIEEEISFNQFDLSSLTLNFLSDSLFNEINYNTPKEKDLKKVNQHKINEIIKKNQGIFEIVETKDLKDTVVLNKETNHLLEVLKSYNNPKNLELLEKWGVKDKDAHPETKIMFYGLSGTGKTLTAYSIGKLLGKTVLSLDCSKILDQYVGESEKKVRLIFDTYKEIVKETKEHPILLLNEADQFLSKRTDASNSIDKMNNQMQNIFLEQIEEHKGYIIATTNLLENLDTAFKRRFNYKIKFVLPTKEERKKIWEKHLPKADFNKEFNLDEINEFELTGGQIKNICFNTSYSKIASKEKIFQTKDFLDEIKKEMKNDESKTVGFMS